MNSWPITKYLVVATLFVAIAACAAAAQTTPRGLPNFSRVNDRLYRGGQPAEQGFAELARIGIRTVIDLRDDDGRAASERERVTAAGMRFVNVPLSNWFGPKETGIQEVLRIAEASENQPVFIHCRRGSDRTGTVIAAYRILHDGWELKPAIDEANSFGLGWWQFWMRDYLGDLGRDHRKSR